MWKPAEPGLDAFPCRQDDLEPARGAAVIAQWRVAETAFERIADDAAVRTRACCVHPESRTLIAEEGKELPLRDARLKCDVGQLFAEVDNSIQSTEVDEDAVAHRSARSISPILPGT